MTISIRDAMLTDCEPIAALSNQLGYPSDSQIIGQRIRDILENPENHILVALVHDKIVGWIHGFYCRRVESDPFIEIGGLVVNENFRRSGIAKMLTEAITKCAYPGPFQTVRVRCNVVRKDSHLFYERIGFVLNKEQKVYDRNLYSAAFTGHLPASQKNILKKKNEHQPAHFPILITDRLTLRELSKNDAEAVLQLRSNKEINKYLDRKPSRTLDDAINFIDSILQAESDGLFYWAITKTGEDQLMGTICLFDFSGDLQQCEIGYELLTEYQGHGIMTEAARKVIAYAIGTIGVKTIVAVTHRDNESSARLLRKLKFNPVDDVVEDGVNPVLFRFTA